MGDTNHFQKQVKRTKIFLIWSTYGWVHTHHIWTLDLCVVVRDLESSASKKKRFFGVFFKAPLFLGKWYGVATYFLYKKNKEKKN